MKQRIVTMILTLGLCLGLYTPAQAAYTGPEVIQLEAGLENGAAIVTADGTLWGWGSTFFGAFDEAPLRPRQMMTGVKSVALSREASPPYRWASGGTYFGSVGGLFGVPKHPYTDVMLIVKENGDLYGLGDNLLGQMAQGVWGPTFEYRWDDPAYIMGNVRKAACSVALCAAITNDNDLYVWGGMGGAKEYYRTMTPEKVLSNVKDVAVGYEHVVAVTYDGSVYTMGNQRKGALGNGVNVDECIRTPIKVFDGCTAVAAGFRFTVVLKTDGTVWGWGDEGFNQLGQYEELVPCAREIQAYTSINGTPLHYANPAFNFNYETLTGEGVYYLQPVQIMTDVKAISAGNDNVFYIKNDNTLWGTGNSVGGVLGGYASYTDKWMGEIFPYYPVQIDTNVKLVCNGAQYGPHGRMLYMKNDGSIWGIGHLGGGFMGNGRDINDGQPGPSANIKNGTVAYNESCYLSPTPAAFSAPGFNYTAPLPSSGFRDVPDGKYFTDPVKWAVRKEITSGTGTETFSPDRICTTAEICTFLWRAYGSPEPFGPNPFSNVSSSDYFYEPALWAYEEGLVSGDVFPGSTPCSRASTVTYLWKLAGGPEVPASDFTDVPASADYAQAVAWAVQDGITNGTSATTFSPNDTCTRGQIVTFLHRALGS